MPARAGEGKKRSTSAPSRARSAAVAERPAATEKGEKGTAIADALYKAIKSEVGMFEKTPNKAGQYHRLRIDGKGFGYIFVPRATSVMVRIPQHVTDVEPKLRSAAGFKKTNYGIWRTLTSTSQVAEVAKAFKLAAEAVRKANGEAGS